MATVNTESLVSRQDHGIGESLIHAHEASIGKAHGNVVVYDPPGHSGRDVTFEPEFRAAAVTQMPAYQA